MSMIKQLERYKNKNIHIVGIGGAEGSAIAEFLVMHGITSVTGHDFTSKEDFKKSFNNTHLSLKSAEREKAFDHLLNLPIKINYKENYLGGIDGAEIVFVSQVWFKYPQNLPVLKDLHDKGVPFKTITNLYFELAPCRIISVTGTNGKTTTSRLINSIFEVWATTPPNLPLSGEELGSPPDKGELEGVKPKIYFAGNDRQNLQVLDKLEEMKKGDVLILETSSTQLLLNSGISPHIGVITNITPNHIDDHGSFENYVEAKKNLVRYQKGGDFAVLNHDDEATRKIAQEFKNNAFLFSRKDGLEEGCFVKFSDLENCPHPGLLSAGEGTQFGINKYENGTIAIRKDGKEIDLLPISDIKIPGGHNIENVLAASAAAYLYGIEPEIIREGVRKYSGIKHRLKLLYAIKGVGYYDDTQATTPESTIVGIDAFGGEIILLAGGDDKGMNYEGLAKKINEKVKLLVLFPGDASEKIENLVDKSKIDFAKVRDFSAAIDFLKKYCEKTALKKGGVVLISPAAAHFYSKYVESSGKSLKDWIKVLA